MFIFSGCFAIIGVYLLWKRRGIAISNNNIICTLLFCLGQNSGSILQFVSVKLIPISTMAALFLGSLMVFGVIMGRIVLNEKLKIGAVMSLCVCLVGFSILIAGPYLKVTSNDNFQTNEGILLIEFNETLLNFTKNVNTTTSVRNIPENDKTNLSQLILGLVLAVVAGFGEAISVISLNSIQDDLENIHVLTFWFVVSGIICSVLGMLAFERESMTLPTDLFNGGYLMGHVVTSSGALLCYIIAMSHLSASLMSILASAQIPVNVLLQYAFFKQLQPINGGTLEILGASIVTLGLIIQPLIDIHGDGCRSSSNADVNETNTLLPEIAETIRE